MVSSPLERPATRWLLGFGAWTVFALLSAVHGLLLIERLGRGLPRGQMVLDRLLDWYTCALFTPMFFWMVRRWPLMPGPAWRSVGPYAVGIAVATVLKYAIYVPLGQWLTPALARGSVGETLIRNGIPESMAFAAMLGVVLAVEYAQAMRIRDAREARLAADLATAQLEALSAQLQPHFLFNTLHGVGTLMRRDPDAADTMLARLADLLRRTLKRPASPEISLAAELELLQAYLDIQQLRFGDRLRITLTVPPGLASALVPRLLLQPLVENAFQHGIAVRAGPGRIAVTADSRANGGAARALVLTVSDDGPGLGNGDPREGTGLGNTRRRLQVLYGERAALDLVPGPGGFTVRVTLPLRHHSEAPS